MFDIRRLNLMADVLENEIRYRELLRAELEKVEGQLAVAARLSETGERRQLDSWVLSSVSPPERLH